MVNGSKYIQVWWKYDLKECSFWAKTAWRNSPSHACLFLFSLQVPENMKIKRNQRRDYRVRLGECKLLIKS